MAHQYKCQVSKKKVIAKLSHAQSIRAPRVRKLATRDETRENALLHELIHLRCSCVHLIELSKGGGEGGGGLGILTYMGNIGMCCCEGYGFQAGYINQRVWV